MTISGYLNNPLEGMSDIMDLLDKVKFLLTSDVTDSWPIVFLNKSRYDADYFKILIVLALSDC